MKAFQYFGTYSWVLLLVFIGGCIKENLEICLPQPVRIAFTFVPAAACAEEPISPTDLNRLTVFLFDQNGLFVQQIDAVPAGTNNPVELSLVPAHYQFVAVAGYDEGQLRRTPFVPGVTSIKDAAIATYLEQPNGALLSAEQVLYLGSDTLTVIPETMGQELTLMMVQRTKTLNITVDGIANPTYEIVLTGNAADYLFKDGQVYLTGSPMIYVPLNEDVNTHRGQMLVNWPLKDDGDHTRFQIINPATGTRLVDEDFSLLLRSVPGLRVDCATSFDLHINYAANRRIIIYINNWKVYDDGYELI